MNVHWVLPDDSVLKRIVPDVEQLVFLLRLTGRVTLDGESFRVTGTELLVGDGLAVQVRLAVPDAEPD